MHLPVHFKSKYSDKHLHHHIIRWQKTLFRRTCPNKAFNAGGSLEAALTHVARYQPHQTSEEQTDPYGNIAMPQTQGQIDECGLDKGFLDVSISWPDTRQSPQGPEKRTTHFVVQYLDDHYCINDEDEGHTISAGIRTKKPFHTVDARYINHPHMSGHSTPRHAFPSPKHSSHYQPSLSKSSQTYSACTTHRHGKGGREMATTQHVVDNSNRDKQVGSHNVAW